MKIFIFCLLICFVQGRYDKDTFRVQNQLENLIDELDDLKSDIKDYKRAGNGKLKIGGNGGGPKPSMHPGSTTATMTEGKMTPTMSPPTPLITEEKITPTTPSMTEEKNTPTMPPTTPSITEGKIAPTMRPIPIIKQFVPKFFLMVSMKKKVLQLFWYMKSIDDISAHMAEVNKRLPKHMILPPSTFIEVVMDLVKNIYWEAKRARAITHRMSMRKQIEIEGAMEDYNEKHKEATTGSKKNGEGQEIKYIRYLFVALEKACNREWAVKHQMEVDQMLQNMNHLATLYKSLQLLKKSLEDLEQGKKPMKKVPKIMFKTFVKMTLMKVTVLRVVLTNLTEKMQQHFTPEHPETKLQKAVKLYMVKKAMPKIIDLFWTMKSMKMMLQKREDEDMMKPEHEIDEKDEKFLIHTVSLFMGMEKYLGEYMDMSKDKEMMGMEGGKPDFPWDKMTPSKREFMKKVMEMIRGAPFLLKKMKFMKEKLESETGL